VIGFRHLLAAQAGYENLSTPRRRLLHERAAAALGTIDAVPLGQVAHHLERADRPAEWAQAAEQAAAQAVALGHEDEAVRLLTDVVRRAPLDPHRRCALAVRLGWAALDTLHARAIIELLDRVLDDDLPAPLRGELKFLVAVAMGQAGGDQPRQQQLLMDAIADLGGRPELRAWALVGLAVNTLLGSPVSENVRWANQAVDLVDQIDDRLLEVFVLGKAGSVLMEAGDPSWHRVAERVVAITGGAPQQRREVSAYCSLGVSAYYIGYLPTAESMLVKGLAAPASRQNRRLEVMLRAGLVGVRYCTGNWEGLRGEVDELLADVTDYGTSRMDVELVAGNLDLAHGAVDEACMRLDQVTELAVEIGVVEVVPVAFGALIRATLARGDVDGAAGCVQRLLDALAVKCFWPSVGWAVPVVVEACVAAGDLPAARHFVEGAEQEFRGLDAPLAEPALHIARGLLTGSAAEFRSAAAGYDALSAPFEAARARELAAGVLFDAGRQDAAALLRAAYAAYQRIGATRDCTRALSLARRHAVSLPRLHRGGQRAYGSALSPREREVVELAATGRSNDEIARTLFISTRTVEKHVGAAMRKLGCRSRTELGHRLASASMNGDFPH
jgi:DNA-binding CsgD family transcriptional regulator